MFPAFVRKGSNLCVTYLVKRNIYTITKMESDFAIMTTSGIPYCFDNRTGKLNIWNLSLFLDGAETKVRETGIWLNTPLISDDATSLVMIKLVLKINSHVYEMNFADKMDLKITKQLAAVSDTSYSVTTKIHNDKSEIVVERYAKYGRICNETRRPVKNPKEFIEAFPGLKSRHLPTELKKTELPSKPGDCFQWSTTIRYSDLDSKMHANQSLYIKSCIDCVTHASKNNKLLHFNGDMIWYPISFLGINYIGESFANDKLIVDMWQNVNYMSIFNFYISRESTHLAYIVCNFSLNKIQK